MAVEIIITIIFISSVSEVDFPGQRLGNFLSEILVEA
jgi:hypothetical protein